MRWPSGTNSVARHFVAVLLVLAAAAVRLVFLHALDLRAPWITFYPAVMLAALYGGLTPGLLATAISALLGDYFWIEPVKSLAINTFGDGLSMGIFAVNGTLISCVTEAMHRYRRRAAAAEVVVALRANEARLAGFASAMFEGLVESEAGRIVDCNEQFAQMVGYSLAEIKGKSIADFVPPEDYARVLANIDPNRESVTEHAILRKDGARISVEAQGRPAAAGSTRRYTAIRDTTERKRDEKALRESEDRFRTLANAIPQLAWIAQADGYIYWYNQRWCEYTGTTPDQMLGWGWQRVHDPQELPRVLERWKASIASGEPFDMTFPLRGADGGFRPFLTRVMPLKDAEGRVRQWFGTNTDVSEQKAVLAEKEALLKEIGRQRESLRVTLSSIGDAVIATDAAGNVVFLNPVAEALTGWGSEHAVGQPMDCVFRIVNERTGEPLEAPVARAFRERRAVGLANHAALLRKDGCSVPIEDSAAPILDAAGQVIGAVLVFHDVTEKRRAEELLQGQMLELAQANEDLARINRAAVGRELRMLELKNEVNALCAAAHQPPRYRVDDPSQGEEG